MADASQGLHEAVSDLSHLTQDVNRAIVSLKEELEAVDWYRQRAETCGDAGLRALLEHNMREEIEHAAMLLEWLRRNSADFDEHLRTYLWSEVPITEAEDAATAGGAASADTKTAPAPTADWTQLPDALTLGSLRGAPGKTR